MKRALLFAVAIAFTLSAGAQKKVMKAAKSAYNDKELVKAYELIQTAKDNDESKVMPDTWIIRGKILQAIAKDSALSKANPEALKEALASYLKAIEIDPESKKEVNIQLIDFMPIAINKGADLFNSGKFEGALDYFELKLKAQENSIMSINIDTMIIFYAGRAALGSKKYDQAISYFNKAISYNYMGAIPFSLVKEAYMQKGDTVNSLETLKKAFEKYPNELNVIVDLVNFYLQTGKPLEALNYLSIAKQKEPNNASYLFAEGTLYEKMNDFVKAEVAYLKSIELDSLNINGYYNLGVMFYNMGVSINNDATKENDNKKYDELIVKRNIEFNKSIPYFEKAHKISPKDQDVAKSLKSLYMFLQLTDKSNSLKAEMGW
jgi:tetratricopeptide (TPR) repeat protein